MKKEDFTAHLNAYGASFARWPGDLRAQAERAMRFDPDLRELHDAEIAFEALLLEAEQSLPSAHFVQRITAYALQPAPKPAPRDLRRLAIDWLRLECPLPRPTLTLPVLAAAGLLLGVAVTSGTAGDAHHVLTAFFHVDDLTL